MPLETKSPYRVAILASGSGSNFQAIVDAAQGGKLDISVELLICDRPSAYVLQRAENAGIQALMLRPKDFTSKEAYESYILQELQERQIDLVVLAGYMRIVTDILIQPYYGRMINIHPSLLPAFPGLKAIEQAIDYGVKQTGVTVHFVDGGMDTGPIIAQQCVEVLDDDTADSLAERIHPVEHEVLPRVIGWLRDGIVRFEDRKVSIIRQ